MATTNSTTESCTSLNCSLPNALLSCASARIRYTCMSVSSRHIAFGANSGSFYVFTLLGSTLARLGSFPELKGQPIDRVMWLTDDLLLLASRALLLIVDVDAAKPRIIARVARADDAATVTDCSLGRPMSINNSTNSNASNHSNSVSTLVDDDLALFVGDARGRVVAHTLRRRAQFSVVKSELLVDLNAPIVQLDYAPSSGLLVSTTISCIMLRANAESGGIQQVPIGTKARDGLYGAAYHRNGGVLFAARPGKRLWRADATNGNVEATFNFAPSLQSLPDVPLLPQLARDAVIAAFPARTQPLVFSRVLPIPMYNNNLLFASESDAVFVIDLANGNVSHWSQDLREIIAVDLRVAIVSVDGEKRYSIEIYVLHSCPAPGTNSVACLTLLPLPDERPSLTASLTFIDDAGAVQPAVTTPRSASIADASEPVVVAADAPASAIVPAATNVEQVVIDTDAADDAIVKKIRRRKTAAQVSRRHVEIETGGAAFVPTGPVQRAVIIPGGESARIDRATLDAVLGRNTPTVEESLATSPQTNDLLSASSGSISVSPVPVAATPEPERPASEPAHVLLEKQDGSGTHKSFSRMLTGNIQKMTTTTKEKLVNVSRTADGLLKTNSLVRKLVDERGDDLSLHQPLSQSSDAIVSTTPPATSAAISPAAPTAATTPAAPVAAASTVLHQQLRVVVPACTRVSEMPFDALSVDRRDECSLPLDLCGFRWRRTSSSMIGKLSAWYRDVLLTLSIAPTVSHAVVAELLSACLWTEAFAPDEPLTFLRAATATKCLDVDDALRCVNMRGLDSAVQFLIGNNSDGGLGDGLELVRAGCRTRDLLRTMPTLLAASASDETRREALEVCVANFPVVRANNVAAWLGMDGNARDENATVLYLLYSRLVLETHTAMRYDAPFVSTMLGVLLRDGAPPRDDVLTADGRFKRGAHTTQWRHERTLLALLAPPRTRSERRLFAIDVARVLASCREVGFYSGVIALLDDDPAIGEALQTALDAGDDATVARIAARCDDVQVWQTVLQKHPDAASYAIASLRPADAVDIVLAGDNVDDRTTRLLLASHERAEKRHSAVNDVMTQLTQQVWRRSDINVAPQLRTVLTAEQAVVSALAGAAVTASDAASIKQHLQALFVRTRDSYDVAFEYSNALPRTVEESSHHWGKAMPKREAANMCAICGLSLSIDPRTNPLVVGGSAQTAAVVAFAYCNHVQHYHCAQLWTAESQTLLSPVACVECCAERCGRVTLDAWATRTHQ